MFWKKYIRRMVHFLAFGAFSLVGGVLLLGIADRAAGLFLGEPAVPINGIASCPFEDKSVSFYDFNYTCSTNSMGLRNDEVAPVKSHRYRILALGDSFTFGWGVESEQCWVKALEKALRAQQFDVEIVNAGVPGRGPLDYWRIADILVPKLKPDMIVVGLYQEDDVRQSSPTTLDIFFPHLTRIMEEIKVRLNPPGPPPAQRTVQSSETHRKYLCEIAQQCLSQMDADKRKRFEGLDEEVKRLFMEGRINPNLVDMAVSGKELEAEILDMDSWYTRSRIWTMGVMLGRIRTVAAKNKATTVAVSIPNGFFNNRPLCERIKRLGYGVNPKLLFSKAPDDAARRAAQQADVPFYEVTQAFCERCDDPDLYFKLDNHFTAKGHALFARLIAPYIAQELEKINGK